ncbi:MAG: HD domain-containing phosphohydrolase [Acidobacteriota bacterium]|nr:HD domain-containing phosphohydrolase [Acidobacteriota bacterium]
MAKIFHSDAFPWPRLFSEIKELEPVVVTQPGDLVAHSDESQSAILLYDGVLAKSGNLAAWQTPFKGLMSVIAEEGCGEGDFLVPSSWPRIFARKALEGAVRELTLLYSKRTLSRQLSDERDLSMQLTNVGIALSAQTDINKLLTMILTEARNLACCDGASLFLIDREREHAPEMVFKLTQNHSISFPFEEKRMPLDTCSISGYVAVYGESLNIHDAYEISGKATYRFNRTFDEAMNYRTRSLLAIPMKNHIGEVNGVLLFVNRKTSRDVVLDSVETTLAETLPFSARLESQLKALASQAAVAIDNSLLISRINHLFEGFVNAAVTAIEQRDPTTSGHSFRVADLTTRLALDLPRSGESRFEGVRFSDEEIREIRYASLLHDFGKVGVREPVLVKEKKLPERGIEMIWQRFTIYKERLRRMDQERRLAFALEAGPDAYHRMKGEFDKQLNLELERFTRFFEEINEANQPTILPEGRFSHLEEIRHIDPFDADGELLQLLTENEFLALSVRKGSLTPEERKEIESHVVHTFNFLERIPWTPALKKVPLIAVSHHEKLNGTGYPHGLTDEQIPLPSKMMTIADIYDALTASDRPYKRAMPTDRALDILKVEANKGLLDNDLVRIFIEAKVFRAASNPTIGPWSYPAFDDSFFKRNVCDYELPAPN